MPALARGSDIRTVIPSAKGAIRHLLLSVSQREAAFMGPLYQSLMRAMDVSVRFTLVVEAQAQSQGEAWLASAGVASRARIIPTGKTSRLTIWARDPVMAFATQNGPELDRATGMKRLHDRRLGGIVQRASLFPARKAPLPFEGGNILIGDDFALVGADTLAAAGWPHTAGLLSAYGQWLAQVDGAPRRIVPVGSRLPVPAATQRPITVNGRSKTENLYSRNRVGTRQPLFHIDLFVALGGRNAAGQTVLLVGDPRLAAQLLAIPLHVGALADHFDDVADALAGQGFAVVRTALPLIYMDIQPDGRWRTPYFASSNNVLLEERADGARTVWMSEFGHDHWPELALTDDYNAAIWQGLGFTVRRIPYGQLLAENLGGLHCLANVIERDPG